MKQKTEVNAVTLVRGIREAQAKRLAKATTVEVMDFFSRAAQRAKKRASKLRFTSPSTKASNKIRIGAARLGRRRRRGG